MKIIQIAVTGTEPYTQTYGLDQGGMVYRLNEKDGDWIQISNRTI